MLSMGGSVIAWYNNNVSTVSQRLISRLEEKKKLLETANPKHKEITQIL